MKELDLLVEELKLKYNKRLTSIMIYGSNANYGLDKVKSNVDLMIVIQKFSSQDLPKIQPLIQKWIKAGNPHPIIVSREEFFAMSDTYTIEYADIKWNYEIVYGEDLIQQATIRYELLKKQIIRESRHLMLKFRGYYLQYGHNKKLMRAAFLELIKSCLIIFRSILRMQNVVPSVYKEDLIDQIAEITRIDKVFFKRLLAFKEKRSDLPDYILDDGVMITINQLAIIIQQVEMM